MKTILAACLCCCMMYATAQNSNIFKGGPGDGHYKSGYTQSSVSLWKGGEGDGHARLQVEQSSVSLWLGGVGDGYVTNKYIQSSDNLWKGGIGDGYADSGYTQSILPIFRGGEGDGWASTYIPTQALPLQLLSFDAEKWQQKFSRLLWKTNTEISTDHFDVERGNDAIHFSKIAEVKAAGNSNAQRTYVLMDSMPAMGFNYYRLKMVDKDGNYRYSPARLVQFDMARVQTVQVYPNPAKDWITISLPEDASRQTTLINIVAANGAVVAHIRVPANSGNTIRYAVNKLAAAMYTVHVVYGNNNQVAKIIVQ